MVDGLSIVIPALNEEENLPKLLEKLNSSFDEENYEILIVDDFSDNKLEELLDISKYRNVTIYRNLFRRGQSESILNGIDKAKYSTIGLIDGDGQNPPSELKKLFDIYKEKGDEEIAVVGRRLNRKDPFTKRLPSYLANSLLRLITRTKSKDLGCSLKIFSKDLISDIRFKGDIHRFIAPLFEVRNINVVEVETQHCSREHGKSNYGFKRVFPVIIDGILFWITKGGTRPSKYVLGNITIFFLSISSMTIAWSIYQKISSGAFIHRNPLFTIGVICFIAAMQFISVIIIKNQE